MNEFDFMRSLNTLLVLAEDREKSVHALSGSLHNKRAKSFWACAAEGVGNVLDDIYQERRGSL